MSNAQLVFEAVGSFPVVEKKGAKRTVSIGIGRYSFVREGALPYNSEVQITSSWAAINAIVGYHQKRGETFQEHFCILTLDTKHHPINFHHITMGTLDASLVHPREVFKPAILDSAAAIILTHNHPSGDPTPSREDYAVTKRLKDAGDIVGIKVLDHIVVGDGTWKAFSIQEGS